MSFDIFQRIQSEYRWSSSDETPEIKDMYCKHKSVAMIYLTGLVYWRSCC